MPLRFYTSNQLNSLLHQLQEEMQNNVPDVLEPYYIVSQTEGMNIWLKHNLARYFGVAANIRFSKPNDILFIVYLLLGGSFQITFNRQSYIWMLYNILGTKEFKNKYPEQASYLSDDVHDTDIKRLNLAERVADLFDQYQIYRQELIIEWSALEPREAPHWQAYLWSSIVKDYLQESSEYHNINYVRNYILEHIDNPEKNTVLRQQLGVLYLFGLSVFTKYHLEIFYKIAQYTDVQFYLINPAPFVYWGDDKSEKDIAVWKAKGFSMPEHLIIGNELLINWGKLMQNTIRLLFQNDAMIDAYEPIVIDEPAAGTLLSTIQTEIFQNTANSDRGELSGELLNDGSLQVHKYYTPQREVEGLYNYLVHLMGTEKNNLQSRDILVVCTDINAYAPYIDGVFSNAPYTFKYSIADVSVAQNDSVIGALVALLTLREDNFTAEQVLSLLDFNVVKERFGIRDTAFIRQLVLKANIKSGIRGSVDDQTYTISWWNGIRSMMYGICMDDTHILSPEDGSDFYPLDMVEGQAAQDVIVFADFITLLIHSVESRAKERPVLAWLEYIDRLTTDFLVQEGELVQEDIQILNNLIREFNKSSEFLSEALSYDIFHRSFVQQLSDNVKSHLFYNGGITFCTVVPMRSIPFQVIAVLGMDDDKFPRKEKKLSFNLMAGKAQLGDRNIKDSDKHLFLETLLSAQSYFYMSYLSHSAKDNTEKNPSTLINDLLLYLQQKAPENISVADMICIQHPLHSFSYKYNNPDYPHLYAYTKSANKVQQYITPTALDFDNYMLPAEVHTSVLHKFAATPIKYFYQDVLRIYLDNKLETIEEHEQFVFDNGDGLGKYYLNTAIFDAITGQQQEDNFLKHEQLKGTLPLKNVGKKYVADYWTQMESSVSTLYPPEIKHLSETSFELAINKIIIRTEALVFERKLYFNLFSLNTQKYYVHAYLKAVLLRALGLIDTLMVINFKNEKHNKEINLQHISEQEAQTYLSDLLVHFSEGNKHPVEMDVSFYAYLLDKETGRSFETLSETEKWSVFYDALNQTGNYDSDYLDIYLRQNKSDKSKQHWNSELFYKTIILPIRKTFES